MSPYIQGYNAYFNNIRRNKNPYPYMSYARTEWFRGWDDAKNGR